MSRNVAIIKDRQSLLFKYLEEQKKTNYLLSKQLEQNGYKLSEDEKNWLE